MNHSKAPKEKMVLNCKSCGKPFDSTFTVEDFDALPREQRVSGTLHLCPYCGHLTIYQLKDYHEPDNE